VTRCKSCGEQIVWAITVHGRRMPLDPVAITNGNVAIVGQTAEAAPLAAVIPPRDIDEWRKHGTIVLYRSHFASCPDADLWRQANERSRA
jgi:hypothetical protein